MVRCPNVERRGAVSIAAGRPRRAAVRGGGGSVVATNVPEAGRVAA